MPITDEHIDHYREHGYAIVEGLLTAEEIRRTLDEALSAQTVPAR